jgi:hypothetical protein
MQKSKSNTPSGYALTKRWFDFALNNPDLINPTHGILWIWIVEHNNTLGWKEKFGLPTIYSMGAIGVRNYKTYKKTLDDLVKWGFIQIISKSVNQHTSCVVALVKNTKTDTEANESGMVKNTKVDTKADESGLVKNTTALPRHCLSTASIDKLIKTNINSQTQTQTEKTDELRDELSYSLNNPNPEPKPKINTAMSFPRHKRINSQIDETIDEKGEQETIASPSTSGVPDGIAIDKKYASIEKVCRELEYAYDDSLIEQLLDLASDKKIIHILRKTREGSFLKGTNGLAGIRTNWGILCKAYPYEPPSNFKGKIVLQNPEPKIIREETIPAAQEWEALKSKGGELYERYKEEVDTFKDYGIPFHYDEVKKLSGFEHQDVIKLIKAFEEVNPGGLVRLKSLPAQEGIELFTGILERCTN